MHCWSKPWVLFAVGVSATPLVAGPSPSDAYGKLPLRFEANRGQAGRQVQFLSRGRGYTLFLSSSEARLALSKTGAAPASLRMNLAGANPRAKATGLEQLPGRVNYYVGNDPAKWRTNVQTFAKVKYHDLYPGVDLIYYGSQRQLEYDFVFSPGADPHAIALVIDGADAIQIDSNGDLVLKVQSGEVRFHQPVVYQPSTDGARSPSAVAVRYVLRSKHKIGFELAAYDRSRQLVIDPVVTYSTYLGGDKDLNGQPATTDGFGIAVDTSGNIMWRAPLTPWPMVCFPSSMRISPRRQLATSLARQLMRS